MIKKKGQLLRVSIFFTVTLMDFGFFMDQCMKHKNKCLAECLRFGSLYTVYTLPSTINNNFTKVFFRLLHNRLHDPWEPICCKAHQTCCSVPKRNHFWIKHAQMRFERSVTDVKHYWFVFCVIDHEFKDHPLRSSNI